ncbi:MAG TPA: universal stress protein [Casimicrobiaceae bacterium]
MAEAIAPKAAPWERVLVAMDVKSTGGAALDAGVALAAALDTRLEGLFVEDPDLVHWAALPFAREISALTGGWRELAPRDIERALRVEAARLERLLGQAAERVRVPWTFATTRGRLVTEALARLADLTVLGSVGRAGETPRAAGSGGQAPRRSVAALFDGSPASLRTLAAAARVAKAIDGELAVLVPCEPSSQPAAVERARLWLATEEPGGVVLPLEPLAGALIRAIRARRSAMLVRSAPELAAELEGLAALAAELRCPLVIVR